MPTFGWTVTSATTEKPEGISTEGKFPFLACFCFSLTFPSVEKIHITANKEPLVDEDVEMTPAKRKSSPAGEETRKRMRTDQQFGFRIDSQQFGFR